MANKVNDLLRHELSLQRVASDLLRKGLYRDLESAYQAVRAILLTAESITSPSKLNAVNREIRKAIDETMTKGWAAYTGELATIAVYDAAYYAALIGGTTAKLKVPGKGKITDFIESALMSLSGPTPKVGVWAEFVRNNIDSMSEQINNLVKAGYIRNQTVDDVKKAIAGFMGFPDREKPPGMSQKAWQRIKDSTPGLAKNQIDALARTGLQHYSQSAREAMMQNNADIVAARVFFATFDNRVSVGCASLHLKEWAIDDDSYVRLPRHFNCRSVYLMRLKGQSKDDLLGTERPAIGSGKNYESGETYKGRASSRSGKFDVERIDATTGFGTWLKGQDPAFVEDVLGKTKAKLFLDGNMDISRFSDALGRPLTLDQLRALDSRAFTRAGI